MENNLLFTSVVPAQKYWYINIFIYFLYTESGVPPTADFSVVILKFSQMYFCVWFPVVQQSHTGVTAGSAMKSGLNRDLWASPYGNEDAN